jgi:hypothetical protein
MPQELVMYNPETGKLLSKPMAFRERGFPIAGFSWRSENVIARDKPVVPGMVLAAIYWDDGQGSVEMLCAPTNCRGIIVAVNRRISLDDLPRPNMEAQVLLRLR